ncbi:hypothetical protein BOV91_05755, partial [Solemya velum gill symbiont]
MIFPLSFTTNSQELVLNSLLRAHFMKAAIQKIISTAVDTLVSEGIFDASVSIEPNIERTRDSSHGDFATNAAMVLCKQAKMNPRALAEKLVAA